jgi:hypothetical protein
VFTSCRRDAVDAPIEGDYTGMFTRSHPNISYVSSNVTLHFSRNAFSGTSNMRNYPALCQGSYSVDGNKLMIVNTCMFTADFDWSFIFTGEYNFELQGNKLRIWKDYGDGRMDVYMLEK